MTNSPNTLATVVQDFVTSLSPERKAELKTLLLNSQYSESWPWYKEVIDRYLTGPNAAAVLADMEVHHPGLWLDSLTEQSRGTPVHEAGTILLEAQKAIGK
jgi:hypothetical protein